MTETHARIRWKHGEQVDESIVAIPDAFRFLEVFEQKCGGPIRDHARDRRFDAVMKERNLTAAKAA